MSRTRRGGYIFIRWKGDHPPPHVHVFNGNSTFISRVNLQTMEPMDADHIAKEIIELIIELQWKGRI